MRVGKELAERHADLVRRYGWDPERLRLLRCELDGVAPYSRRFMQGCVSKARALEKRLNYWAKKRQAYLNELAGLGFFVPDCCGNYSAAQLGWDLFAARRPGCLGASFVNQFFHSEPGEPGWLYVEPEAPLGRVLREYTERPQRADDLWVWNRWAVALGQGPVRLLRVRGEGYAVEHRDRFGRLHRFHDDGRRRDRRG